MAVARQLGWEQEHVGLRARRAFAQSAGSSSCWQPRSQKTQAQRGREGMLGAEPAQPSKAALKPRPLHLGTALCPDPAATAKNH